MRCVAAQRSCEYPAANKDQGKKKKRGAEDDAGGSENGSTAPLPVLSSLPADLLKDPPSNGSDSQMDISALLNLPSDPAPPQYEYPPESSGLSSLFEPSVRPDQRQISGSLLTRSQPPEPFDLFNVLTPFAFHPPSVSPEAATVTSPNAAPTPGASSQRPSKRPKLEDLPKSRLLARRAGKTKDMPPTPQPVPMQTVSPRLTLVDSMLQWVNRAEISLTAVLLLTMRHFSSSARLSGSAMLLQARSTRSTCCPMHSRLRHLACCSTTTAT